MSASRRRKRRDVVSSRGDEHAVEPARTEDVEHVLQEPLREQGALVVVEHRAQARLAVEPRLRRHDGPGGPPHRATSDENASTSRARRSRSSRDRITVEAPSTGIVATVPSSPRSTTIARRSPR